MSQLTSAKAPKAHVPAHPAFVPGAHAHDPAAAEPMRAFAGDFAHASEDAMARQARREAFIVQLDASQQKVPGFGHQETPEAVAIKQALLDANMALPTAQAVSDVYAQVLAEKVGESLVQATRAGLKDPGALPPAHQWGAQMQAATEVMQTPPAHTPFNTENLTALVFAVLLEAQKENMEEKRHVLRNLRMYNGMLDALQVLVAKKLLPAQAKLAEKRTAAPTTQQAERVEVLVQFPNHIDTHWAHMDENTGAVTLNVSQDDGPAQARLDQQGIASLLSLADQWRTSIQNSQSKQSMEFTRLDNAMSSTWNIITAVLKLHQDGTNAIIRNGLG